MKEEFRNLNEMSDSRELLDAKPNPIVPLFIYLLIIMLVITLIWAYFGEMDEVVKANGVIRTKETESTIRNQLPAEVDSIHFQEGQHVEEGEILFTLNQNEKELQKGLTEEELNELEEKIKKLKTLKKSVEQGENLFEADDSEFAEKYISYESNLSLMRTEYEGSTLEISENIKEQNNQKKSLNSQREKMEKKMKQLERLQDVVQKQENVFKKSETPYYNEAAEIITTIRHMEKEIVDSKDNYKELKALTENHDKNVESSLEDDLSEGSIVTEEQVKESKRIYENTELELEQYINQQHVQISNKIEQEQMQLDEIIISNNSTTDFSKLEDNQQENHQLSLEKYKLDMVVQVNNDIESVEQQIDNMQQELTVLEQQIEDSVIKAPVEGIVNVREYVSVGDFLQAGTEVLRIVPEANDSTYKVQLYVLNEDIVNTKIGDQVSFRIHALPYQEYGKVYGEITKIGTDAVNDTETGVSYYVVEATINNDILLSHKGKETGIKVGMTTDAQIIADSKKILYFLLEKINLRD